jgi:hypothetical protein
MALSHGPPIVTNGLVLALDAADRNSYPGSGTTWTDLSGRGNTGTLTGAGYNSANGGSLTFDGTDDIVNTTLNQTTTFGSSGFTFNLALNVTDDGATDVRRALLGNTNFGVDGFGFGFNHDASNTNKWNITFYPSYNILNFDSYTPNFGNNEFITLWYNGTDTIRLYRNGELLSSLSVPNTKTYRNANVLIGTFNQGGWSPFLGKIYLVQAYNRALTASEVSQNFNALRGRFNI